MNKIFLLGILLILNIIVSAQDNYNYVDKKSTNSYKDISNYYDLADSLTNKIENKNDKIRAIYIWITKNITYDLQLRNKKRRYPVDYNFAADALQKRKGVCHHYASLFNEMTNHIGIKSFLISGISINNKSVLSNLSHSWNAVEIDSSYYLIDATWAAGYVNNNKYVHQFRDKFFLIKPLEFIKTHMPFDPIWQLMNNTISVENFISQNTVKNYMETNFNYKDSIYKYNKQHKLDKLINTNRRIIKYGIKNTLIKKRLSDNKRQIENIQYNNAIYQFNNGVNQYNIYIKEKNKQFKNISDYNIYMIINKSQAHIYKSYDNFRHIYTGNKELNMLIKRSLLQIHPLLIEIEREKIFVNKYLSTEKKNRNKLFYINRQ